MKYLTLLIFGIFSISTSAEIITCELDRDYSISIYFDSRSKQLLTLHNYENKEFSGIVSRSPMAKGELKISKPIVKTIPIVITRVGDKKSWTTYGVAIEPNGYPILFSIERWADGSPIRYFDPYLSEPVLEGTCSG